MIEQAAADIGVRVSLERVLDAREYRVARQTAALTRFQKPLVSMTVVMPGPVKDGALPRQLLTTALRAVDATTSISGWTVLLRELRSSSTGPEALYVVDAEPQLLKQSMVDIEDQHPLGRLWDLDVIVPGHRILSRRQLSLPERRCLLCERNASECARSRRHTLPELSDVIQRMVNSYEQH